MTISRSFLNIECCRRFTVQEASTYFQLLGTFSTIAPEGLCTDGFADTRALGLQPEALPWGIEVSRMEPPTFLQVGIAAYLALISTVLALLFCSSLILPWLSECEWSILRC